MLWTKILKATEGTISLIKILEVMAKKMGIDLGTFRLVSDNATN